MRERLKSVLILFLFPVCKPLRELYLVETGIRMNLSAEESATPERGDLVEIFLPPLGLILGGFLGKRDVSIFQICISKEISLFTSSIARKQVLFNSFNLNKTAFYCFLMLMHC